MGSRLSCFGVETVKRFSRAARLFRVGEISDPLDQPLLYGLLSIDAGLAARPPHFPARAKRVIFLTMRGAYVGNGFSLTPQGGMQTTVYRDAQRVRRGSYVFYETERPDYSFLADANWFRGAHEIDRRGVFPAVQRQPGRPVPIACSTMSPARRTPPAPRMASRIFLAAS